MAEVENTVKKGEMPKQVRHDGPGHDPWWPSIKLEPGDKVYDKKKLLYYFVNEVNWSNEGQCISVTMVELQSRMTRTINYKEFERMMDEGEMDWWVPEE